MSQPTGIIAKIILSEDKYKEFVRKTANELLAQNVFGCIKNQDRDYYVFRYLKKENALYAFFYFHYGNKQFLIDHPLLSMFKNIEPYLDPESTGYIVATTDCVNNEPLDFVYYAEIENKTIIDQTSSPKEPNLYWADAEKYFFKYIEIDFNLAITSEPILEKSVITKVKKLQEADRIQNLKNNLHKATPQNPIELFTGYFYNGKVLYTFNRQNSITVFDQIDLKDLQQTPYGLCDNKGVIVGDTYIATDHTKFKKHQKGETIFYSSADTVYNSELDLYPDSDGSTFRLLKDCLGEDKKYLYFAGQQLPKETVGDYQVNESGYFYKNMLLHSKKQIRVGEEVLEGIDAETFEIIEPNVDAFLQKHSIDNPSGIHAGCFILYCQDKQGELIIHNYDVNITTIQVERITSLSEYLKDAKEKIALLKVEKTKHYYPEYKEGADGDINYFTQMNEWLSQGFDKKYNDWQYNASFYIALNNYFYTCFQLYLKTKDKAYLNTADAVFDKIASTCFVNPYIFHNTTCIHAALGETGKAILSISSALNYGYKEIALIWNDEDLRSIAKHPNFISLKEYYDQIKSIYPYINITILDKIGRMPETTYKQNVIDNVMREFSFPTETEFDLARKQSNNPQESLDIFQSKVAQFINCALQYNLHNYSKHYERFKNSSFLTLETHLFALNKIFGEAHRTYGSRDFAACQPIIEKIRGMLLKSKDTAMTNTIRMNNLNRVFNFFEE